ncbi:hypothetical protein [Streptomyces sp. KL116D]|uniref:hypothetical protein n=1 Tax=Streptomyces sp. KL116D TaxID=3045152 RepID=UPI003557F272
MREAVGARRPGTGAAAAEPVRGSRPAFHHAVRRSRHAGQRLRTETRPGHGHVFAAPVQDAVPAWPDDVLEDHPSVPPTDERTRTSCFVEPSPPPSRPSPPPSC